MGGGVRNLTFKISGEVELTVSDDEKLAPLNSTVVELRKSLDEAITHVKFVDAKYDDLLKKMKKGDEDRKALWTENKTLKLADQTLEKQHASLELQLRKM